MLLSSARRAPNFRPDAIFVVAHYGDQIVAYLDVPPGHFAHLLGY